jgi:hypothetical protein
MESIPSRENSNSTENVKTFLDQKETNTSVSLPLMSSLVLSPQIERKKQLQQGTGIQKKLE